MTRTLRSTLLLVVLAALAIAASGCGSSSGSGSNTASVVPDNAFLYFEVNLDPSGSQQAGVDSILGDLPGSGSGQQRLDALIEKASKSDKTTKLDYLKDIKPLIGDRAAVFVAGSAAAAEGGSTPAALVVATSDVDAARKAIEKDRAPNSSHRRYRDVEYLVEPDKGDETASGIVDGFLVTGSDAGMKAAIDATKTTSLDQSDRYKQALKGVSDQRVALVYEDLQGILQLASSTAGGQLGPIGPLMGRLFGGKPVVATVKAEHQALVVDGSFIPTSAFGNVFGSGTPSLTGAPADSWAAFALPDIGKMASAFMDIAGAAVGGRQQLEDQVRSATGLDLTKDLLSWPGNITFFVSGDSKDTIGGGAVITSKDPAASKQALTKIAAAVAKQGGGTQVAAARIPGASGYQLRVASAQKPIFMVQKGNHVALTYGEQAASAALAGGGLESSADFKRAAGQLGAGYAPSVYVSAAPILRLAESFGAGGGSYAKAKPYLTMLDYLIIGSRADGAKRTSRTRLGFK